jgi:hypothetical protein
MRPTLLPVFAIAAIALAGGCRGEAPPPAPSAPVSSWTANDGEIVAAGLADGLLNQAWSSQFRDRNARAPRIVLGGIDDRSGDHVDVTAFAGAIAARIGTSDKVTLVDGEADYRLDGVIIMNPETVQGSLRHFFQITVRLTDVASGELQAPVSIEHPVDPVQQPAM